MFTGIVEQVGQLAEVKPMAGGFRVRIETPLAAETVPGDSIAVGGVCLTALVVANGEVHADIGPETARITTLGTLARGQRVNLERPLRADARLGGHFVLGHVDGVGVVEETRAEGESLWLTISFPPSLSPLFIRKGSVTVDGVSLTVAGHDERGQAHTAHCDAVAGLGVGGERCLDPHAKAAGHRLHFGQLADLLNDPSEHRRPSTYRARTARSSRVTAGTRARRGRRRAAPPPRPAAPAPR